MKAISYICICGALIDCQRVLPLAHSHASRVTTVLWTCQLSRAQERWAANACRKRNQPTMMGLRLVPSSRGSAKSGTGSHPLPYPYAGSNLITFFENSRRITTRAFRPFAPTQTRMNGYSSAAGKPPCYPAHGCWTVGGNVNSTPYCPQTTLCGDGMKYDRNLPLTGTH